jgi:hypothetical protein
MFTEKEEEQLNKFFRTHTFDYYGPVMSDTFRVTLYYKLKLKGTRKMISVGEYYDYVNLDVEIVGGDDDANKLLAILGHKDYELFGPMLSRDYRFRINLENQISKELKFFTSATDFIRIKIDNFTVSKNYFESLQELKKSLY